MARNKDIKFEITEHIGVIGEDSHGWTKQINLVSWNHSEPKYDIRAWDANLVQMSKGICLTEAEARKVAETLTEYFKIKDGE